MTCWFSSVLEAGVPNDYKDAILKFGMEDIVMTERLSGTPCAVINTPYAKKVGYKQNFFEKWLGRNPRTKKYFKTLVNLRGLKLLENAVQPGNYNNLWCAGQSIELIHDIVSCEEIIKRLESETLSAMQSLRETINS